MPIALKVLLQLAVRDIGQLTDIESRRALAGGTRTRAKISGPATLGTERWPPALSRPG
jgi:hypothetical protein